MARRRYRKRGNLFVTAVQLNLETEGLVYRKWGAEQRCTATDWIVDNQGDVYTVKAAVFARTYRRIDDGKYVKTTPIWAEVADTAGRVETNEGETHYVAGDYLVSNMEDGTDAYAISGEKFESTYELDTDHL